MHLVLFLHLDVVEDVGVHVEEGEGSGGVVDDVLLCPWLHHNPLLWEPSLLKL